MTLREKYFCQLTVYDNNNKICSEQESEFNSPQPKIYVFGHSNRNFLARPMLNLVHKIQCAH